MRNQRKRWREMCNTLCGEFGHRLARPSQNTRQSRCRPFLTWHTRGLEFGARQIAACGLGAPKGAYQSESPCRCPLKGKYVSEHAVSASPWLGICSARLAIVRSVLGPHFSNEIDGRCRACTHRPSASMDRRTPRYSTGDRRQVGMSTTPPTRPPKRPPTTTHERAHCITQIFPPVRTLAWRRNARHKWPRTPSLGGKPSACLPCGVWGSAPPRHI